MDKYLGFGGLGDCFIVLLKLLEYKNDFIYTHIDTSENRLNLSHQLLDIYNIKHECKLVNDIRNWWELHNKEYDKCFNVFAKGYIDIPLRSYHWQPCIDDGYSIPFSYSSNGPKYDLVVVQVNAGTSPRNYKHKPIVRYVENHFDMDKVMWVGTDTEFKHNGGYNFVGKFDLDTVLRLTSVCSDFVGFNGILLYNALWNKTSCFLFTDHQDRNDLRISTEWKSYLKYDLDEVV